MDPSPQPHDALPTTQEGSMSHSSHLHSPVSLSTEGDSYNPRSNTSAGIKRKRSPNSRVVRKDERKKVSRACDACKTRKVRCSGTQPCNRCSNQSLPCEYNTEHRRGRPPTPEIVGPIQHRDSFSTLSPQSAPGHLTHASIASHISHVEPPSISDEQRKSSRSSQEPEETRFEGNYIGPTSGIAFLHRAQRRFKQDFEATISNEANAKSLMQTSVFSFGDGHYPDQTSSDLVFPSRDHAKRLLERYFDFAIPTYRFLHRATVEGWLEELCDENEQKHGDGSKLSDGKTAVVLLVLATAMLYREDRSGTLQDGESKDKEQSGIFFTAAERKLATEIGPVRLESVQARLAQCLYLMGSSRINQAWYLFGTTYQMIIALGLHRKRFSQSSGAVSGLVEIECRKRAFWSAYTLDGYFSVILGRPRNFRDEDIDQHLPDRVNDSDLTSDGTQARSAYNQCVSDAPVFHAKLARIVGKISTDLYPTNKPADAEWIGFAEQYTTELKTWKEALPAFLEPTKVDPSILIPIFQRQSTVLRLAYAHALILANRQSLLSNFADLSRRQEAPDARVEASLKECIDAAFLVVDTVNSFIEHRQLFKAFWFTHYISFCAIATLYVYTIQRSIPRQRTAELLKNSHIHHFEAAEKCQRKIAETTAKTSPFRRYNIILDELKKEVLFRLRQPIQNEDNLSRSSLAPPSLVDLVPQQGTNVSSGLLSVERLLTEESIPFSRNQTLDGADTDVRVYETGNLSYGFQTGTSTPSRMLNDPVLDLNLFGSHGELVGWSEFDACAIGWPDGFDWNS